MPTLNNLRDFQCMLIITVLGGPVTCGQDETSIYHGSRGVARNSLEGSLRPVIAKAGGFESAEDTRPNVILLQFW